MFSFCWHRWSAWSPIYYIENIYSKGPGYQCKTCIKCKKVIERMV